MPVTRFIHPNIIYRVHQNTDSENVAIDVKGESTTVYSIRADNSANGSPSYLKLYNTNDVVVVGTTDPTDVYLLPASTDVTIDFPGGKVYNVGLQESTVTTGGTGGTTSPTSAVVLQIAYQ